VIIWIGGNNRLQVNDRLLRSILLCDEYGQVEVGDSIFRIDAKIRFILCDSIAQVSCQT
jgi:hypothetical protein